MAPPPLPGTLLPAAVKAVADAVLRSRAGLGARHRGEPLEGALAELKAPDIPAREAALLRACVRKLRRG